MTPGQPTPPRRLNLSVAPPAPDAAAASWTISRRLLKASLWCTFTLGASFGAVNLLTIHLALGPVPPAHNWVHATFQVIGFVFMFLVGLAYQVIPRSCGVPLAAQRRARATLPLLLSGVLLRMYGQFGPLLPGTPVALLAGGLAILAGILAFASVLVATWRSAPASKPRLGLGGIAAGTCWWVVAGGLLVVEGARAVAARDADLGAHYNEAFYAAALVGGAMSWIQGMFRRIGAATFALRPSDTGLLALALVLWQLGTLAATLGACLQPRPTGAQLFDLGLVLLAAAIGIFVWGSRVLSPATAQTQAFHLAPPPVRRTVRLAFVAALLFGALAALFGVSDLTGRVPSRLVWDGARHALALGCITPLILGLGSFIVPRLAGTPLRRTRWRSTGLALIGLGLLGRECELLASALAWPPALWISGTSGLVAATGVVLAGGAILGVLRARPDADGSQHGNVGEQQRGEGRRPEQKPIGQA
ncbi:MAG TPA: hypothetical protein VN962_24425, partial [Polyangia bacterium]|nr:hypothetical protein [Polyangia bacterium]